MVMVPEKPTFIPDDDSRKLGSVLPRLLALDTIGRIAHGEVPEGAPVFAGENFEIAPYHTNSGDEITDLEWKLSIGDTTVKCAVRSDKDNNIYLKAGIKTGADTEGFRASTPEETHQFVAFMDFVKAGLPSAREAKRGIRKRFGTKLGKISLAT